MSVNLPASFKPARGYGANGIPNEVTEAMWAEYQRTGSLRRTGQAFGRSNASVRDLFARRGLRAPALPNHQIIKGAHGRFALGREFSDAEILAEVKKLRRAMLPPAIKNKWRRWDAGRRAWLVRLIWAHVDAIRPEDAIPRGPYSKNVEPFDYSSPRAHALAAEANRGHTSQTAPIKIKVGSRGVIYQGKLWTWTSDAYRFGKYEKTGRPSLQETILRESGWEVPAGHVIRFADGNQNNFEPANLIICRRETLLRENQSAALTRKSRAQLNVLLGGVSPVMKSIKTKEMTHA